MSDKETKIQDEVVVEKKITKSKETKVEKVKSTKKENKNTFVRIVQKRPSHVVLLLEDGSTKLVHKRDVDLSTKTYK